MAADATNTTDEDQEGSPSSTPNPAETAVRDGEAEDSTKLKAEAERLRKALAETNRKAASDRKRLEEIDKQEEERKQGQLSETEREKKARLVAETKAAEADRRAETLAAQLETAKLELVVEREARAQGWPSPELALKLIDRDRITFNEDKARYDGVKEAVKAVADQFPTVVGAADNRRPGGGTPPRADATRRPNGEGNPPSATRRTNVDPYEQELQELRPVGRM